MKTIQKAAKRARKARAATRKVKKQLKQRESYPGAVPRPAGRPTRPLAGGTRISTYSDHGSPDMQQFKMALADPFSAEAVGCRVCDSYTLPTATYHLRLSTIATTTNTGVFSCAVLPSPCLSLIMPQSGGGSISGLYPFSQNASCFYAASPSTMASLLSEYRTVAWGVRLVAKDSAFTSKGKIYIAPVATTENAPSWNTFETVTGTNASIGEYCVGQDASGFISYVMSLPGVRTFSMQDLLRGTVMLSGIPTNGVYYSFKGTTDRSSTPWAAGQVLADEGVFNSTTGLVNATAGGRKDVASLRGGRGFIIVASGMPVSVNEFDIEIVYHVEGTPNVSNNVQLVPSSMRPARGSTSALESVLGTSTMLNRVIQYVADPANIASATRALAFLGM